MTRGHGSFWVNAGWQRVSEGSGNFLFGTVLGRRDLEPTLKSGARVRRTVYLEGLVSEAPRKGPVIVGQRELWVAADIIEKAALILKEFICF